MTEDIRLTIYFNTQEEKEFCQNVIRNYKDKNKLKKTGDALYKLLINKKIKSQQFNIPEGGIIFK